MRIKNKLTFKFVFIVSTILIIFSIAIYYFSADFREQDFDKRLVNKGMNVAKLLIEVHEIDNKLLRIIDRNNLTSLSNEKITIYDHLYRKIYSSDDDPEYPVSHELFASIKHNQQIFFNNNDNEVAGILYSRPNEYFYVIVSAEDKSGHSKLNNLKVILLVGYLLSMGVVFLSGWIFSGQALKPISDIVHDVKNISAKNLNARIDIGSGQDEISQLAIQFNQMLERIEQSFQTQKTFVSNASHELRTPLSTIRAQLEVTLSSSRPKEEYQETLISIQEDINELIQLTNGLLALADAEADSAKANYKKIRLDELLYQSIADVSKKYPAQQIRFHLDDSFDDDKMFVINGNETLLRTAFNNLLDNSCKYSSNKPIEVSISFIEDQIKIVFKDLGKGIRPAEIKHLFDPFYRGSNVLGESGHGIGLPLSKRVIQLHNGTLVITSQLDHGTTALVQLPIHQ